MYCVMHEKEPQELPEHTWDHVKSQNFVPPDPPHTIHFVRPHFLYLPWAPPILSAALGVSMEARLVDHLQMVDYAVYKIF